MSLKLLLPILAIVCTVLALGFALDWKWRKTHFTAQDDERLEAPKERSRK